MPRFAQVSWSFVDEHVQRTVSVPGYWRNLARSQQKEITQRFWEVGALDARALAGAPVGLGESTVGPMSRLSGAVQPPRARMWLWHSPTRSSSTSIG